MSGCRPAVSQSAAGNRYPDAPPLHLCNGSGWPGFGRKGVDSVGQGWGCRMHKDNRCNFLTLPKTNTEVTAHFLV